MIRHIAIFLCSLLMCSTTFADSVTSVSLGALLTALNERMLLMKMWLLINEAPSADRGFHA